jgi:hypothetical protein
MAGLVLARVVDPVTAQQVVWIITGWGDEMDEMISPLTGPPSETPGIRGQDPEYKYTGKTRKFLLFVSCGKYAFKSLCLPK